MFSIRNRWMRPIGLALTTITVLSTVILLPGQTPRSSNNVKLDATTTPSQGTESALLVTQQNPVANQNDEQIPELGITLTVPDAIKDLIYQVRTVTLKDGQTATLAMFSTTSLTQLDAGCSASEGPLGSLEKVAGQYPSSDPYATLNYGRLVKQFPTFYIAAGSPQSGCSTNTAVQPTTNDDESNFAEAESTIVQ